MKSLHTLALLLTFSLLATTSLRAEEKTTPDKNTPEKPAAEKAPTEKTTEKPAAKPNAKSAKANPAKPAPGVTEDQAQQALAFAAEQHPELAKLLDTLKATRKAEFQRALRELHMARTRLENIKTRQPARYPFELEIWKAGSRARLLAAQTAMDPAGEKALQDDLRKVLTSQYEAKQKLLEWEKQELSTRLAKMDADLKRTQENRQQDIERDLQQLLSSAQQKQKALENQQAARKAKKNASAKATAKTDSPKKSDPEKSEPEKTPEANKKTDADKK